MYNSDGYVMIDMKDVNMSQSSQHITGIYNRVVSVIDTNKLALIVNAGSNTPMAAVVHKRLNYYVINTTLYIFTINSNDIVIVEEAGTATVDVEIVPTLTEGVKVADFAVGAVEGSIYAPAQQSEINDSVTASNTTWSSDKINTELSAKADSSSLATVATTGAYSDLTGTPTIPVLTDLIDDSSTAVNKVWSSDKTASEIAAGAGVTIDDTTTSLTKTWSSDKINSEVSAKPSINDVTASSTAVYSSDKVDTLLFAKADTATTYTKTEVDTALSGKANLALTNPTYESNTKISQQGTICCKSGKLITFSSVFRAQNTQIGAGETVWTIKNENIKGTSPDSEVYLPYVVDSGEGYGYLVARNSGNDIIIKTNIALQMPRLMFLNGVIPTI